jgi:hypothetical protein
MEFPVKVILLQAKAGVTSVPYITCPACGGSKHGPQGERCWGCNGNGFVELTPDDEAEVIGRGNIAFDRKNGKLHQLDEECRPTGSRVMLIAVLLLLAIAFIVFSAIF